MRDVSLYSERQGGHSIELHWRIADEFTYPASTEYLIEDAQLISIKGGQMSVFRAYLAKIIGL